MELLNEWLPLIVTLLLSAITIGLVMTHVELMNIRDACRVTNNKLSYEEPKPNSVQEVKVVNRVPVDVMNNVDVEIKDIADYAGPMKVAMDGAVEIVNYSGPLEVKGDVDVHNVVRTTPY